MKLRNLFFIQDAVAFFHDRLMMISLLIVAETTHKEQRIS
jgi:hypothetical protein